MNLLETERLTIRELDVNDASLIYKYSKEKTMLEELPDQVYESRNEAREIIEFLSTKYKTTPQSYPLVYGVVLKKTNTLIGHVGLSVRLDGVEIGYAIGMDYQGNGYATEAVGAFSRWAKCNLKLSAIYGIVKAGNKRSEKVLSNNHFTFHEEVFMKGFGGKYLIKVYIYE
ncbi:GNAT family N-acetyltransferase [Sporolactobacillus nakayamae]|uniref:Acetyltransferase (GNAT) domain-containing protein n=1 Tax=Sporolactobacillus nakayamae TaxID=269670 RepID=A0A1I2R6T5_9BACL|nr:GNAT family N-acetyltransferase [Sporolactobacillus nakayamae]SFG33631.1 Acetyltransferase (GNAT) domain-containing protein [Sporolactobacillus nakayamae]